MSCSRINKSLHNIARVWIESSDDDYNVIRMWLQIISHTLVFAHSRATNDEWYRNLNIKIDAFCVSWRLTNDVCIFHFILTACVRHARTSPHFDGNTVGYGAVMSVSLVEKTKHCRMLQRYTQRPVNTGHIKRNRQNMLHFTFYFFFAFGSTFHSNSLPLTCGRFSSDNNSINTHLCMCSIDHCRNGVWIEWKGFEKQTMKMIWKIETWIMQWIHQIEHRQPEQNQFRKTTKRLCRRREIESNLESAQHTNEDVLRE